MKIYVLTVEHVWNLSDDGHDYTAIKGIFSSKELANEHKEKLIKNYEEDPNYSKDDDDGEISFDDGLISVYFDITEYDLDKGDEP